jgi:hypothetical protein
MVHAPQDEGNDSRKVIEDDSLRAECDAEGAAQAMSHDE